MFEFIKTEHVDLEQPIFVLQDLSLSQRCY